MKKHILEFETPIHELKQKITQLNEMQEGSILNINQEISLLEEKLEQLINDIYDNLTPWQIVQVARHFDRPRTLDYIDNLFSDFIELFGDRHFADDKSIVCGIGRFEDQPVAIIGHQKGRDTKENIERNFGMPKPEGYRKALRIMQLAEKFKMPILTFVDTNGAYPGIGAEERNQSEAIGRNLFEMAKLKTPIIVTIIGEGGSGGALAIAVGDQINMLEYAIYSVISPEGGASILWKDSTKANIAADVLGITAKKLKKLNLIDNIITEPKGGAHNNKSEMMDKLKLKLKQALKTFNKIPIDELLNKRLERIINYGQFIEE